MSSHLQSAVQQLSAKFDEMNGRLEHVQGTVQPFVGFNRQTLENALGELQTAKGAFRLGAYKRLW